MKNLSIFKKVILMTLLSLVLAIFFQYVSSGDPIKEYWLELSKKYNFIENWSMSHQQMEGSITNYSEKKLIIDAVYTDIEIEVTDVDQIRYFYSGYMPSEYSASDKLIKTNEQEIKIMADSFENENKSSNKISFLNFSGIYFDPESKQSVLRVVIPKNIDFVEINAVSSDVEISGACNNQLNVKTVSGDLNIRSDKLDPSLGFESVSGDAEISFIEKPNVIIDFETTSGQLDFDTSFTQLEVRRSVQDFQLGGAKGRIKLNTVSGDIYIGLVE